MTDDRHHPFLQSWIVAARRDCEWLSRRDHEPGDPRAGCHFDPEELRQAFRGGAKAIIFNSPHNPSGRVFTRAELQVIADLCLEFDTVAITDEIYEHLVYDGHEHIPISTLPGMWERTISISGMGKTFAVTGWRLGYAIAPEELTVALRKVHDFTTVCAPTPFQAAMVVALNLPDSYYEWLRGFYAQHRERMLRILADHGFACSLPLQDCHLAAICARYPDERQVWRHGLQADPCP